VGYATTKWASELLLQDLHASCDIPVNVYRCSLVLPHRRFHGQINHADVFSRLLYGLLDTGLAPRSFYAHQCSSPRHYDGIPVDVVADAIASISTAQCAGHRIYHVSNFHRRDGVCLDRIVDWVASAGRPLERIDDYETWFRRFREALEQLDERRRRRSPLPALERWERPIEGMLELDTAAFQRQVVGAGGMLPGSLDEQFIHHVVRGITAR
jgi:fatty acid CoA ligase FadD9